MDNYHFDITSDDKLEEWIKLATPHLCYAVGCSQSRLHGGVLPRLVFYTSKSDVEGYTPLPVRAGPKIVALVALEWLKQLEPSDYGVQPGIDGDLEKGWRLYNGAEHCLIEGSHSAYLAIEPCWAIYHK